MATTLRSIRVDDLVWARWQAAALTEGISLSDWIRKAADRALTEPEPQPTAAGTSVRRDPAQPGSAPTVPAPSGSASAPVERAATVARAVKMGAAVEGARRDLASGVKSDFKPDKPEKKKR